MRPRFDDLVYVACADVRDAEAAARSNAEEKSIARWSVEKSDR